VGLIDYEECQCEAWCEQECACGLYGRPTPSEQLRTLGANLETAASLAALYRLGYTKGFEAGSTLAAFCDPDDIPEPYFPMADSRPTAERLGWSP